MGASVTSYSILFLFCVWLSSIGVEATQTAQFLVNVSESLTKKIPETLFGVFFEEINHAGAGGLWAELVSNRGFEGGGATTPSNIAPWSVIGSQSSLTVLTEPVSSFVKNKIALKMTVLCDIIGPNICPSGGVGIYNPGFWGMNIEQGKTYKLVFYVRSIGPIDLSVSLTDSNGSNTLATANILSFRLPYWKKIEVLLEAKGTNANSRLQFTTTKRNVIWLDQVSLMPTDTYNGHGFRKDLFKMVKDLKPKFLRFPGGCFVEGNWLRNAVRWKETIGPWEERPGHFNDVWNYWTDDGLGHLEFLQLAEDLEALPVWVFNNGFSHNDEVNTSTILPFVQEVLDGIEFSRGDRRSKWGSVRAALGHPEPFDLRYVAAGNEDCGKKNYLGNYLKFYNAIKSAYPDIKVITNCDASSYALDHPADLYEYHMYSNASVMFASRHKFDRASRNGPKAFVSEYAVYGKDAGNGTLLAAIAEAGFLIGLEQNSDAVEMSSYAPLFVNANDRKWIPDAIVYDSSRLYGTPSYWTQQFFKESNGATLLNSTLITNVSCSLIASAIAWKNVEDKKTYLRIKAVNFGSGNVTLQVYIYGLERKDSIQPSGSTKTELKSCNVKDENSFEQPNKVVPVTSPLPNAGDCMTVLLSPYSLTSFDLLTDSSTIHVLDDGGPVDKPLTEKTLIN